MSTPPPPSAPLRRSLLRHLQRARMLAVTAKPLEAEAVYRAVLDEAERAPELDSVRDLYEQAGHELGSRLLAESRVEEARTLFRGMLRRAPDSASVYFGLSQAMLPGQDYKLVLAALHERLRPELYVEVGVCFGDSLCLAKPPTLAVGIDPAPQVKHAFTAPTKLFVETSDAFFAAWDSRPELAGRAIDMAFLDGLHLFEQTLRDFINIERRATGHTLVLTHDCIPLDALSATRERSSTFWAGDVWKLLPILWRYRPELDLQVIAAPPTGLLAIRNLDRTSSVLAERFDAIVEEHMALGFDHFEAEVRPRLRPIQGDAAVALSQSR